MNREDDATEGPEVPEQEETGTFAPAAAPAAALVVADAGASEGGTAGDAEPAPGPETAPGLGKFRAAAPMLLVAFITLLLVAVGVFLTKRQLRNPPPAAAETPTESATPPVFEIPESEGTPLAGATPPPGKILNNLDDALKTGAAAINAPPADGAIDELPPPPEAGEGAMRSMQDAAKDAARLLAPEKSPPAAIDLSAPDADAALETLATPDEAPPAAEPPDDTPPDDARAEAESALRLDLARLRGSLDTERQHTERQAAEIARLAAEISRLQSEGAPLAARARGALMFSTLAGAANSGAPYRDAYDAYAAASGDIAPLARYADAGLPRAADLRADFPPLARAARAAARRAAAKGPLAKLAANLADKVDLRPAGPRAGDDAAAILSRAEAALLAGDLAASTEILGALDAAARAPFDRWLDRAAARLDAERAIAARTASLAAALDAEMSPP